MCYTNTRLLHFTFCPDGSFVSEMNDRLTELSEIWAGVLGFADICRPAPALETVGSTL